MSSLLRAAGVVIRMIQVFVLVALAVAVPLMGLVFLGWGRTLGGLLATACTLVIGAALARTGRANLMGGQRGSLRPMWWLGSLLVGIGVVGLFSFGVFFLVWGSTILVGAGLAAIDQALSRARYILAALLALALIDLGAIAIVTSISYVSLTTVWSLLGSLAVLVILVALEGLRLRFTDRAGDGHG